MSKVSSPFSQAYEGSEYDQLTHDSLIRMYAPTIKYMAQHLAMRLPPPHTVETLIHAGAMALMDAIRQYNSRRAESFASYVEARIRGAMLEALRRLADQPHAARQQEQALEEAYETLAQQSERPATDEEVATFLALDLDTFYSWLQEIKVMPFLGRETPALSKSLQAMLAEALDTLPRAEKIVISLYYYEQLTMQEIAQVMDLTPDRVAQLYTSAMLHVRAQQRRQQQHSSEPKVNMPYRKASRTTAVHPGLAYYQRMATAPALMH